MKIYFVNKRAKFKGPYDIVNNQNNRLLQFGDICVKETDNSTNILVVCSNENNWSKCNLIEAINGYFGIEGNTVLFDFDGINNRKGEISILHQLHKVSSNDITKELFANAIDILGFKTNDWKLSIIQGLFPIPKEETLRTIKVTTTIPITNRTNNDSSFRRFESYLPSSLQETFVKLYSENKSLEVVFEQIKREHPSLFRKALFAFKNDYPNASIYDI